MVNIKNISFRKYLETSNIVLRVFSFTTIFFLNLNGMSESCPDLEEALKVLNENFPKIGNKNNINTSITIPNTAETSSDSSELLAVSTSIALAKVNLYKVNFLLNNTVDLITLIKQFQAKIISDKLSYDDQIISQIESFYIQLEENVKKSDSSALIAEEYINNFIQQNSWLNKDCIQILHIILRQIKFKTILNIKLYKSFINKDNIQPSVNVEHNKILLKLETMFHASLYRMYILQTYLINLIDLMTSFRINLQKKNIDYESNSISQMGSLLSEIEENIAKINNLSLSSQYFLNDCIKQYKWLEIGSIIKLKFVINKIKDNENFIMERYKKLVMPLKEFNQYC